MCYLFVNLSPSLVHLSKFIYELNEILFSVSIKALISDFKAIIIIIPPARSEKSQT